MKLNNLLEGLNEYKIFGSEDKKISVIVDDSREAVKNCLFVAIKGLKTDAHNFISQVIESGASVVVGEKKPEKTWLKKCTYVMTKNSRKALGIIASNWYGNPSSKLKIVGVTGTKGKTTTSTIIYHVLKSSGIKTGLISSIGAKILEKTYDTGFHVTSPEPLQLQKFLQKMVKAGCEYAVVEATSHGLDQERFSGVNFDIGVMTNISHEHLDYHKTIGSYKKAKLKMFSSVKTAVLNKDDEHFQFFKKNMSEKSKVVTYGLVGVVDYSAEEMKFGKKTTFKLNENGNKSAITFSLLGKFNVLNCLAAIAVAKNIGISIKAIKKALNSLPEIPGRLEEIKNDKGIKIYIDFAHTPSSLESVLEFLNTKKKNRLICVFGCAGERDWKKRSMMGRISASISDISVFTAEDPRSEDVNNIIGEMVKGAKKAKAEIVDTTCSKNVKTLIGKKHYVFKIPDRSEAISFAIQRLAKKGDTVVVCGKGHEKSMNLDGIHETQWSEHGVIESFLK